MKIDKEYPATHSMDTSWYIVDDEGNVGFLDYNSNGPVPLSVEETHFQDLMLGHYENGGKKFLAFSLTDEQVMELLDHKRSPYDEKDWFTDIVQIDKEKKQRYIEICNQEGVIANENCISEQLGLYWFNCDRYVNDEGVAKGALKTMLDEGVIEALYDVKEIDDNIWEFEQTGVLEGLENFPYFLYHQRYYSWQLPDRLASPEKPVIIEQIPQEFRHRLHHIPGSFRDMSTLQIAERMVCNVYGVEEIVYDGCGYGLLPDTNGTERYFLIDYFPYSFYDYCSIKQEYDCEFCSWEKCSHISEYIMCDKPKAIIVASPNAKFDYNMMIDTDLLYQSSIWMPYLPMFPYPKKDECHYNSEEMLKFATTERLTAHFKASHAYFDNVVSMFSPHVLMVERSAGEVFESVYHIQNHQVTINDVTYPAYYMDEREKFKQEILDLISKPYRGKEILRSISKEDMERLLSEGKAYKWKH